MNFPKACSIALILMGLAGLDFLGCVRVSVNTTPGKGMGAPKAPSFAEQSLLVHQIHVSRFDSEDTTISQDEVEAFLNHGSLVVQCGKDNDDVRCSAFPESSMQNDFGCNIEFQLKNIHTIPSDPSELINWPPTFSFAQDAAEPMAEPDPLNCRADGVICSHPDLKAVWGTSPANQGIKIIREILFCEGGLQGVDYWAGCSQFPQLGQAIAVKRAPERDSETLGILYSHEIGHTRGLFHTDRSYALNHDLNGLMAPSLTKKRIKLNREECFRFRRGLR